MPPKIRGKTGLAASTVTAGNGASSKAGMAWTKRKEMDDEMDEDEVIIPSLRTGPLTVIPFLEEAKPTKSQVQSTLLFERDVKQIFSDLDEEITNLVSTASSDLDGTVKAIRAALHAANDGGVADKEEELDLNVELIGVTEAMNKLLQDCETKNDEFWTRVPEIVKGRRERINAFKAETNAEFKKSFAKERKRIQQSNDARVLWKSIRAGLSV
ncbi:hypothetical protein BT69DRAFT_1334194 [Atractiella rhizophila]|nr:hypothetical protein BT69DRAFT_1334194 [Atractiella rhizophila]